MKRFRLASAALVLSAAAFAQTPAPAAPGAALRPFVRFTPPAGWRAEERANGADPVVSFRKGLDVITLSLYGAEGSAYEDPGAFLRGPAASTLGAPPRADGRVKVAGRSLALYRRGYPVRLGDPHAPSSGRPPELARERFVVLPLRDGRFVVASHAFESAVPSFERDGERAFTAFLKTLQPSPKPRPKK
ncbi:MAG: hypothetical protein SF051_03155 [Elusimicrobiota bacterium]|nr:hypothetical protein [Elusimicrobiota bacterium]